MADMMKYRVIPCIVGFLYILLEIFLLRGAESIKGMMIFFLAGVVISASLLWVYKRFDVCGWFTLSSCGGIMLLLVFLLLSNPDRRLDYSSVYIIAVSWLAPAGVCTAVRLIERRGRIRFFPSFFRLSSLVFLCFYTATLGFALFSEMAGYRQEIRGINLIPFSTILPYVTGARRTNPGIPVINLAANLLLFIPLGFYLSVFARSAKVWMRAAILLTIPVGVEILQFLLAAGIADIDDVILNFAGGLGGMAVYSFAEKLFSFLRKAPSERLFVLSDTKRRDTLDPD